MSKPKSGLPRPTGSGLTTPTRSLSRESLVSGGSVNAIDDWTVGDRCFVNGTKPGKVAFLGETRFAPGEWAGVVLDEPTGKNDGSVAGVRYFQCHANLGLFCKVGKLTRKPLGVGGPPNFKIPTVPGATGAAGEKDGTALKPTTGQDLSFAEGMSASTVGGGDALSPFSVDGSFFASTPAPVGRTGSQEPPAGIELGDRVIVSGTKIGILRFVGPTDFAQGEWAGVELDQPVGKNDGSVQGKRYFACKPRYGLFAPLTKVVRAPTQSTGKIRVRHTKTSALRQRSGSQESLSSLSSFQSSASTRQKVRLGVAALGSPSTSFVSSPLHGTQRSQRLNSRQLESNSNVSTAFQESLREKEQHIDQLLRERDLERAEIAKAAQQAEEAEQTLAEIKEEKARTESEFRAKLMRLETTLEQTERERRNLSELFDEEKRKAEDLQFQVEEESILKAELEAKLEEIGSSALPEGKEDNAKELDSLRALERNLQKSEEQRRSLQTKNVELETAIVNARKLETELRSGLLEAETKLETLHKEAQQGSHLLEMKVAELEKLGQEKESEINKLTEACSEAQKRCHDQQDLCLRLDNEVKDLMAKVETYEHENHMVTERCTRLEENKLKLEGTIAHSSGAKVEQVKLIETKNAEIKELTHKLADLQSHLDVGRNTLAGKEKSWEEEKGHLLKEIDKRTHQIEKFTADWGSQSCRIKELELALANAEADIQERKKNLDGNWVKLSELEGSLDNAAKELTLWEQKAEGWDEEKTQLEREILHLKHSHAMAADAMAKKVGEDKDQLAAQVSESEKLVENLKAEKNSLEAEIQKLKHSSANEIAKLQQSGEEFKSGFEEKVKRETELGGNLAELQKEIAEWDARKRSWELESSNLNQEIQSLKEAQKLSTDKLAKQLAEEKEQLTEELNESRRQSQTLETGKDLLELEKKKIEEELLRVKNRMTEQSEKNLLGMEELNEEIRKLKETLNRQEGDRSAMKKKLSEVEEELKTKEVEMNTLKTALTTAEEQSSKVSSELCSVQSALDAARSEIEAVSSREEESVRAADDRLSQREFELQELNAAQNAYLAEIETLRKGVEDLNSEKESLCEQIVCLNDAQRAEETEALQKSAEEKDQLAAEVVSLRKSVSDVEEEKKNVLAEKGMLQDALKNQETEIFSWKQQCSEITNEQENLKQVQESLLKDKAELLEQNTLLNSSLVELRNELSTMRTEMECLTEDRNALCDEKLALEKAQYELSETLQITQNEATQTRATDKAVVEKMSEEVKKLNLEISDIKRGGDTALRDKEKELLELKQLYELEKSERLRDTEEVETLRAAVNKLQEVEKGNAVMDQAFHDMKKDQQQLIEGFLSENNRLRAELDSVSRTLQSRELEFEQMRNTMRGQSVDSNKSQVERLEQEKFDLLEKITDLESRVQKTGIQLQNQNDLPGIDENEQISFLNSVIVDMKRKNSELLAKIDILQRTDILNLSNGLPKVVAPRLYCDICEEFDLHETEDCPKQAGEMAEEQENTKHHGIRNAERPYCDNCEEFGHWSTSCENETF